MIKSSEKMKGMWVFVCMSKMQSKCKHTCNHMQCEGVSAITTHFTFQTKHRAKQEITEFIVHSLARLTG